METTSLPVSAYLHDKQSVEDSMPSRHAQPEPVSAYVHYAQRLRMQVTTGMHRLSHADAPPTARQRLSLTGSPCCIEGELLGGSMPCMHDSARLKKVQMGRLSIHSNT